MQKKNRFFFIPYYLNSINIQIHKILPMKENDDTNTKKVLKEYTQYMFAVYVPKEKKYFVKG